VAKPGDTARDINEGIRDKKGLLITPGVYEFEHPVVIKRSGFVVLGLGMATLVPTRGRPALEVRDGLSDVRIAGLLLDAGTPMSKNATEPMLRWGTRAASVPADRGLPGGVLSDVFARIGAFKFRDCSVVRADTMIEVNADDVLLDNVWLWHADHDDCGTDPGNSLNVVGSSDECYSKHGLVVTGDRVTAYGVSAEHMVGGDMVAWSGDGGESYFYQCELPYHSDDFSAQGHVGYAVAPEVTSHKVRGFGVYIIKANGVAQSAYHLPPTTDAENLITVVIIGKPSQFANTVCLSAADGQDAGGTCYQAQTCEGMRCLLPNLPGSAGAARLFLDGPAAPRSAGATFTWEGRGGLGLSLLFASTLAIVAGAAAKWQRTQQRASPRIHGEDTSEGAE